MNVGFLHDVAVEANDDLATVEGYQVPVFQWPFGFSVGQGAPPAVHSTEGYASESCAGGGVAFADPFGDPEGHLWVKDSVESEWVDVQSHAGLVRELVLAGLAIDCPGIVRPVLAASSVAVWAMNRENQAGNAFLTLAESV
jgi:hypothetical protein